MAETAYDEVAYPAAIFRATHPDRLAVIARLHGLSPPPVETARVLEIGGGEGINAISFAAAYPDAQFLSFDLAASAVARGKAVVDAAGLGNVRVEIGDIVDMAESIVPGSYDYIIAHGVYAWVPPHVRTATMALIGRALSPHGVAFVSYNALPGGYVRMAMRDMLLHALKAVEGIDNRIVAARAFLVKFAKAGDKDDAVVTAMRRQAATMLDRPDEVLFHDELGPMFAPHSISQVVAAAAVHGLAFLNDAGEHRLRDGFLPDGVMPDSLGTGTAAGDAVVEHVQTQDYAEMRFFRQSLFVRAENCPARVPCLSALRDMHVSGLFETTKGGGLRVGKGKFTLRDAGLTAALMKISAMHPRYMPVSGLDLSMAQLDGLFTLFAMNLLQLSTGPEPFTLAIADHPLCSALARAQIAAGTGRVSTLDHMPMAIDDPIARRLLLALDGRNDITALEKLWGTLPHPPQLTVQMALAVVARQKLLVPS